MKCTHPGLVVAGLFAFAMVSQAAWAAPAGQSDPATQEQGAMDHSGMDHSSMDHSRMAKPIETGGARPGEAGQGAFGAIVEVVSLLEADPATDWSRVSIDTLRRHLVDMNNLTLASTVETRISGDEVIFRVAGKDATIGSIQTMVPMHAQILSRSTPWQAEAVKTADGVVLTITTPSPEELAKVRALGFFGIMASGHDHPQHHLMMAKGAGHGG